MNSKVEDAVGLMYTFDQATAVNHFGEISWHSFLSLSSTIWLTRYSLIVTLNPHTEKMSLYLVCAANSLLLHQVLHYVLTPGGLHSHC